jgi:hypothetical protein
MRFLGFLVTACLLASLEAAGRDIYVDNMGGSDMARGDQPMGMSDLSGPVQTIAKAVRLANPGDRIVLTKNDEPYRESVTLSGTRLSGFRDTPVMLEGNGATLDGSAPAPKEAWENYRGPVFRFRPRQMHYQQLFIDKAPAIRVYADPMSASPPALSKREWCLHGGYVYFCVEPNMLPRDYNLTHSSLPTGVTLHHVEKVGITNLIIQGYQLDGIHIANSATKIYLGGLTIRGNGRNGVTVGGACQVEFDGCIVGNNGEAQILTLPMSETSVVNSKLFSNTGPGRVDQGGRFYLNGMEIEGNIDDEKLVEQVTGRAVRHIDATSGGVGGPKPSAGPDAAAPPGVPLSPEGKPLY